MATPTSTFEWISFLASEYSDMFWQGTLITLGIAFGGTILGFVLGFIGGVIKDIDIRNDHPAKKVLFQFLKAIVNVYVEIFRDTPMIVQAMVLYYGLRQAGFEITPIPAALLVVILNTGAYMTETVRAGINAVDQGQKEGAWAMGMGTVRTMMSVILPQAFRNIIPEMGNMFLTNLKMTSVLNVIGVTELFMAAKTSGAVYYKYFEAYLVIALIYFVLCFAFNLIFKLIEKWMAGRSDYVLAAEYMMDAQ